MSIAAGELKSMNTGLDVKNGNFHTIVSLSNSFKPTLNLSVMHSAKPYFIGFGFDGALLKPTDASNVSAGMRVDPVDTSMQWGVKWNAKINNRVFSNHVFNYYFSHVSGSNTVGSHMTYDHSTRSWSSKFGLINRQADHTWKFRLSNAGLVNVLLQWKPHTVAKATLNTSFNV